MKNESNLLILAIIALKNSMDERLPLSLRVQSFEDFLHFVNFLI